MTREEALAYLRFEAELMAHLKCQQIQRQRKLRELGIPEQIVEIADRSYRQAMDDMTVFGSLMLDRAGAWDAVEEERWIATGIKVGPLPKAGG